MNPSIRRLLNSLTFRTIMPIIIIALFAWGSFYIFVLRSISQFADDQIQDSFVEMKRDIQAICDREYNSLIRTASLTEEHIVRARKKDALNAIDHFMKQSNLRGTVRSHGETLYLSENMPKDFLEAAEASHGDTKMHAVSYNGHEYFPCHIHYAPWSWDIALIRDSAEYMNLIGKVRVAYGLSAFILAAAAMLFIYSLRRNIRNPLDELLAPIREGRKPDYHGITEFEYLSENLRNIMDLYEKEMLMLNNLYHISVVKRGDDFFDEVTMAISRLFHLNASISRLNPDGRTERIVSLYLNGTIKKNFDIELRGTPCEGVLTKKHIYAVNTGIYLQFPNVKALADTQAEAFIGLGIFNRKGDVIGIINAFGQEREFSESDIKVLQTIGEMVASEFERIDEEHEKECIREQLFQAHKMEAIGTLAGGIAHDFNNMLQGILGHASLIKAQMPSGHELYDSIDTIEHISDRAAQLTKQLLGFARKGKYVIESMDINDIVRNVLKIITKTFDRKIEIITDLADDLFFIEGDRGQIEQVIMNLCLNARDAMPHGGKLQIVTFNGRATAGDMPQMTPGSIGTEVEMKISDTGFGISDQIKDHIFEPFFTTKELGKGTGMGLAMVYGVVTNHHGTIKVTSSAGKGTSFHITFPAMVKGLPAAEGSYQPLLHGKGTILVVDDEEFVRSILKDMLENLGYGVILASHGREAIDIYARQKERIDLVILDLVMPVMDGQETYEHLIRMNRDLRVLIASGQVAADQAALSHHGQLHHTFIQKPFKMHDIATIIKSLLSI